MMIRSMPPASSHLAERPVPAPPPTIGTPSTTIFLNFSRILARAIKGMKEVLRKGVDRALKPPRG